MSNISEFRITCWPQTGIPWLESRVEKGKFNLKSPYSTVTYNNRPNLPCYSAHAQHVHIPPLHHSDMFLPCSKINWRFKERMSLAESGNDSNA